VHRVLVFPLGRSRSLAFSLSPAVSGQLTVGRGQGESATRRALRARMPRTRALCKVFGCGGHSPGECRSPAAYSPAAGTLTASYARLCVSCGQSRRALAKCICCGDCAAEHEAFACPRRTTSTNVRCKGSSLCQTFAFWMRGSSFGPGLEI